MSWGSPGSLSAWGRASRTCGRSTRPTSPAPSSPGTSDYPSRMFDSLSDRLGATLDGLRGQGRLSEDDINRAMREIRLALLEADVNFGVVKEFVAAVKERALGADVMQSLTPGQQVIKIVHEELTSLMGTAGA